MICSFLQIFKNYDTQTLFLNSLYKKTIRLGIPTLCPVVSKPYQQGGPRGWGAPQPCVDSKYNFT